MIANDRLLRWLISPFGSLLGINAAGAVRLALVLIKDREYQRPTSLLPQPQQLPCQ